MNEHKKFEILCALVAVGQASDADLRDLNRHLPDCIDCQNRLSDFAQISAQAFPLSRERYPQPRLPKAMTTRFVERARAEGIPLAGVNLPLVSHWSFQSLNWKGSLAAAVLLLAIIAGGVSRTVHSRARWANASTVEHLELPAEPSTSTQIVAGRSEPKRTKLPAPLRTKMSKAHFEMSKPKIRSRDLRPFTREVGFNKQLFSNHADGESSRRLSFDVASLTLLAHRNPGENSAPYWMTSSYQQRPTFITASLNFPVPVFSFNADRHVLNNSPQKQFESTPNIDWYHIWRVRTESLRTSNYPPQSVPGAWVPAWPFSQESAGEK